MNRGGYKRDSLLLKLVALVMLSVMATLLITRSVHTCLHSGHECEHSSEGEHEHSHNDCKICNFEFSLFDRVESLVVTLFVTLITTIVFGYIPRNINVNILSSTSRAPPAPII